MLKNDKNCRVPKIIKIRINLVNCLKNNKLISKILQ